MMKVYIIAAVAADNGIGAAGDLLYHISADLKRFKSLTVGKTVIMGRKTFESLPKGALPDRHNIVISRQRDYSALGITVVHSLSEALRESRTDVFIIGGASVYAEAIDLADGLRLTEIHASRDDADTFFPAIGTQWVVAETSEVFTDPRTGIEYRFVDYNRVKPVNN